MEVVTLDVVADRVAKGDALSQEDARVVLDTPDLIAIASLADEVRRRLRAAETTFVRVIEIHVDAVPGSLPAALSAGEFRLVGRPEHQAAAVASVRAVSALAGRVPVTGFSLPDIVGLAPATSSLVRFCKELNAAGLAAVAEAPIDLLDGGDHVKAVREGGLRILRLTVRTLADDHRVTVLERARSLQRELGGFRAFAPLPRIASSAAPTTGYDDVKQVALSRLMLPDIESIQVDWPLYGPKLAQVALTMGADDVDGVAALDTGNLGHRRSAIEEITRNIRAAALVPVERDGLFERIAR
jgi:aminodeoxyfutalosine synthase